MAQGNDDNGAGSEILLSELICVQHQACYQIKKILVQKISSNKQWVQWDSSPVAVSWLCKESLSTWSL